MISLTKENYLKAIYFLEKKHQKVSLTQLAKRLEVSTPTANNMVKKLESKGYVVYEKYKPLQLTNKGRKEAMLIVRKHRLSEMFLSDIMGFGWEEVHDIAEEMEHLQSEKLFNRMNEMLDFPTEDPHGSPIPTKDGKITSSKYIALSAVAKGQHVILKAIGDSSKEFLLYLNKKEIKLDTSLSVIDIEPFDNSYIILCNQKEITLSKRICDHLLVEMLS